MNTRIAIGMFRMGLGAGDLNDRIDLDSVNAGDSTPKSRRYIVARTRSDDYHITWMAERLVWKFVIVAACLQIGVRVDVAIGGRQILYALVVVPSSANYQ